MKTIAISIDEGTLEQVDGLVATAPRLRNRSAVIRAAVRDFAERERRRQAEAKEHKIVRKHRKRLARDTRALVAEQARP